MSQIFKRLTLPGFENVPVYKVFGFLIKELTSPVLILRAKAIAFSFFIALFPMIVFLFSLVGKFFTIEFTNNILGYLKKMMPNKQMVEFFIPLVNEVLTNQQVGIMSLSFLFIIFFMKNGVVTMMQSFNIHVDIRSGKLFVKNQVLAVLITFVILFLFVFTILLVILGKSIMSFIFDFFDYDGGVLTLILDTLRYSISLFLNLLIISILYYLGPINRPEKFKIFNPGSIVATIMIAVVSLLFSYYVKNIGSFSKLYGSMGTIILTLLWLYWNAISILVGYELNRSIDVLKSKKRARRKRKPKSTK